MPRADILYRAGLDVAPFTKGIKRMDNGLKKVDKTAWKANKTLRKMTPATRDIGRMGNKVAKGWNKASWGAKALTGAFKGLIGVMAGVGAGLLALRVVNDMGRWFSAAATSAREYGDEMRNIDTLLTDTPEKMGSFNDKLLALHTGIAPTQELSSMTAGLYDLISATGDTENAMAGMEAISRASVGGYADMATTVNATAKVLNAYGIAVDKAEYATDLGLKTVERGMLTYGEYGRNISMVAGSAAVAKVPLEELHAAIATATKIQRPEAAFVGLRTAINKLTADKDKLREFGIEWNGLVGTIEQMKDADLSPEDWFALMPEERAAETLKALVLNFDDLQDNLVAMGDAAGTTGKKFEVAMESDAAKVAKVAALVDELAIKVGDELNEAAVEFIDNMDMETVESSFETILRIISEMGPVLAHVGSIAADVASEGLNAISGMIMLVSNNLRELDKQRKVIAREAAEEEYEERKGLMIEEAADIPVVKEQLEDLAELEETIETTRRRTASRNKKERDSAFRHLENLRGKQEEMVNTIERTTIAYREAEKAGTLGMENILSAGAPEGTLEEYLKANEEKLAEILGAGGKAPSAVPEYMTPGEYAMYGPITEENLEMLRERNALEEEFADYQKEWAESVIKAYLSKAGAEGELSDLRKAFTKSFEGIGKDFEQGLSKAMTAGLLGNKDALQMFGDILYQLVFNSISTAMGAAFAASGIGKGIGGIFSRAFGGLLSFIPGFQHGTPPGGTMVKGSAEGTLVRLGENFTNEHLQVTPEGGGGGFGAAGIGGIVDAIKRIQIINQNYLALNDLEDVGIRTAEKAEMGGMKLAEVEG